MPKYLIGTRDEGTIRVSRSVSTYMVDFIYPESVKESYSYQDLAPYSGRLPMSFYREPLIGETLEYGGHDWHVVEIRHYPTRRNTKQTKRIPLVSLEYVGPTQADVIE